MKVSVCAIIKDEQLFLKEWIDWHLSIGVNSIFLCEDVGSMSHKDITDNYDSVTLIQYKEDFNKYGARAGSVHQENLFRYFLDVNPTKCDWCAFIDIDEFIHIDGNLDIHEVLSDYEDYNGLYLYWKFYGASNHIERPIGNVQDNYTDETDCNSDNGWRFKSIVNLNKCRNIKTIHEVCDGVNTRNLKTKRVRTFYKAYLRHYFTKSWEDWITRFISRGDLSKGHRKINQFFEVNPNMLDKKEELMKIYLERLGKKK